MSMKQEIETWVTALAHYDSNEFEEAVKAFQPIADTSKILFNCGVIRATLGEHDQAVDYYQRAVSLDQYLAVAYFQQGVSNFLVGDFEEALANFNDTLLYLRGNNNIDYEQLGLKFKLYSCEVLFNRGLSYIYLQEKNAGMQDLAFAVKEKVIPEHDVIHEAIKDNAEGYTVFSIPIGVVFRPNEAKVKNVRTRDYLGRARLVAQAPEQRRDLTVSNWARDDRLPENLSYAAANLVRTGLSSRRRQQSEPPMNRNVFPPTPPPEAEKPANIQPPHRFSAEERGASKRSHSATRRPEKLELGIAAFERPQTHDKPRRGTQRSASERPAERRPDRRSDDSDLRHRQSRGRERLFGVVDHDGSQEELAAQLLQSDMPVILKSRAAPRPAPQHRPAYIEEEEEIEVFSDNGLTPRSNFSDPREGSFHHRSSRNSEPRTSLRKVRLKAHFADDTRYIIVLPTINFEDLQQQISRKFAMKQGVRIKTRDEEGDLITMGDQDDLDMAIGTCKEIASKEGAEMGKMEIWIQEL